jgi:hypothetical protein
MENILNFVVSYGWGAFLIICVFFMTYVLVFKDKVLQDVFTKERVDSDIKFHSFFRHAQYRMMVELPALTLCPDKPVKQGMFIDLLQVATKCTYDTCLNVVSMDMSHWDSNRWASEISTAMANNFKSWNDQATKMSIPPIVINKFMVWCTPTITMVGEYITALADSKIYSDNLTRTNTLLLIMNLLLINIITDAERTLRDINGDLDGVLYKGEPIEH